MKEGLTTLKTICEVIDHKFEAALEESRKANVISSIPIEKKETKKGRKKK